MSPPARPPRACAGHRKLFGQIIVRHMCATPEPSNPSPSSGCRKFRPTTSYQAFQSAPDYVPPVWPAAEGRQQMMMHIDIAVDDLAAAVADAVGLGAILPRFQPQEDVRVLLDPAGHPFCLYFDHELD